ncbi:MAG: ergothioneine biosynthesis protein EgtB [Myxococcota bacterium]
MARPKDDPAVLAEAYRRVRGATEALCAPLTTEDHVVQAMPDASPPKWHLAHTTWFFDTFILDGATAPDPAYAYLFNSYYQGVGPQFPRAHRGTLSRPTVAEVRAWRERVDAEILERMASGRFEARGLELIELGLHHEQQHQELLVVDLKSALLLNPMDTPIVACPAAPDASPPEGFVDVQGGLVEVGHGGSGFAFDNEGPRHRTFLEDYRLARSLVTNREYVAFVEDGGYRRPELWLSDGWYEVQAQGWEAPLYWERQDGGGWIERTLGGRRALPLHAPVTHVSTFEADAFARWRGARLPTEFEWEHAAARAQPARDGTFLEDGALHPEGRATGAHGEFNHLLGEVWEHTASAYRPYPGFVAPEGAVGEYNGKFMNAQYVLRGGSAATPRDHVRLTYRNFFYPDKRWVFTGIRLAETA